MNVPVRLAFVNITGEVAREVAQSGITEGLCLVNAMHITASVFINDDEPGLHEDYKRWLEQLAPYDPSPQRYHHNRTGEDNGDAHHKRQVMGREVVVAVTAGKLDFGPWEQIFYGEFDGRREQAGAHQGHRGVTTRIGVALAVSSGAIASNARRRAFLRVHDQFEAGALGPYYLGPAVRPMVQPVELR